MMKKHIYDESNGLSYTLHGDYYLPDLAVNDEEATYGKYGMLRKQFLKEHRPARYQYLLMTGNLTAHLNQVDVEAREQVESLTKQMVKKQDATEQLKMKDQMKWAREIQIFGFSCKISTLKKSKLSHRYADKYGIERKKSLDFFLFTPQSFMIELEVIK